MMLRLHFRWGRFCWTLLRAMWLLGALLLGATLVPEQAPATDLDSPRVQEALRKRLASGVLRWGGDAEGGAPYQLRDPNDPERVIGFEVELADALAARMSARLGVPLVARFVQYEWVSLPLGLEKGDFDLVLSGFEYAPDRAREYLLSEPYYIYHQELAARHNDDRIHSLADCRGKAVGTLSGSTAERVLRAAGIAEILGFDGQVEPYLDLELGRLDAVLLDAPIAIYYGRPNPQLRVAADRIGGGSYAMALRHGDEPLVAFINAALSDVMIDGRLREILVRWHLWNVDQAALARGPRRAEELAGLGFDDRGTPLAADAVRPVEQVDVNLVAASAEQWTFSRYAPLLLAGAGMTLLLSLSSMVVAILLGLLLAMVRLYAPRPVSSLAWGYVEFFRGVPLLLLLFFLYFGLAHYGIYLQPIATAIVGFGLTYAAYESEIYRAAIRSVPLGQWEAARALGMSEPLAFRRVIFPQAIRVALAPMTNDFVALFKDTSLVSVIAVHELTKEYLILSRSSLKFVEMGLVTAVLYLAMSLPLSYLSRILENRWGTLR